VLPQLGTKVVGVGEAVVYFMILETFFNARSHRVHPAKVSSGALEFEGQPTNCNTHVWTTTMKA
jgi:hypothetical protein